MRRVPGAHLTRTEVPLGGASSVPEWWRELFERATDGSIYVSPAWVQTWLELYGRDFSGSWLRWQAGAATVAGCLLLRRTVWRLGWPMATLCVNGSNDTRQRSPTIEFNRVLRLPGYDELIARDLALAVSQRRWTRLEMSGYEDSVLARSLLAQLPLCATDRKEEPSPYVDLVSLASQDFAATLGGKLRGQIRRCRRMYEESRGPVVVEGAEDAEHAISLLGELAVLHNATWRSRGLTGAFANDTFFEFHRRLIRRLWPMRGVDVLRTRAGEKVIAYIYSFLLRGKVYCYQTGIVHERDNNLRPGLLAHACAIDHYRERGYREYDFLAGDMRYKRSLAKSQRTLVWSMAYRRSLSARAALLARFVRRKLIAPPPGPLAPSKAADASI